MTEYRLRDIILLITGFVVIQFFLGLVIFHLGYEKGATSKVASAQAVFSYCATGKVLEVNGYRFDVRCIERHPVK